ncbi:glycoside hydrolase family 3 C-terminal domain-containing protein [Actinoplanes sp. NPDC051411]|uniref:glycoside hydrolase family 3 C-terminal domain-containing protein n=1 Tax=Actinoplanes sp. NPDC051411 TaxID=3155522 RepID=UPI0034434953
MPKSVPLISAVIVVAATIGIPATAAAATAPACPWVGSHAPVDTRVGQVLKQMTLDEKIAMVHGAGGSAYTGYIPGDSRLCIPALKMQDGPVGVRMADTTQLPSASTLAASFDPALARQYGGVIGAEDKTKGVDVDLGPTINIVRDPRWGRSFESYSEDPYLTGQIGAADIEGVQSKGVMAQVKHYAVYNQETNRNTAADNAIVDDRTVREIYTAAFGDIVAQADPSSVMCSYSSINGVFACENAYLNTILKKDFGFDGFITSDWGGTHSTVGSANAGMDMQMPDDTFFGAALKAAVLAGQVPPSRVDDMVTRIMREEFRFGLFDHPSADTPSAIAATPAHIATARQVSEDGTVLLKNAGGVLPLNDRKLKSIAVIGDGAGPNTMSHGGGSAVVNGTGTVTPFDGIKARAGSKIDVEYAQGNAPTNGALPAIDPRYFGSGLQGAYYDNTTLSGTPVATRTDPNVNYTWTGASPIAGIGQTNYSVKWTGTLTPPTTGTYTFALTSDDGSRLFIGGQQVIDNWRDQATNTEQATVSLTAGQSVPIEVDFYQAGGDSVVGLGWQPPGADLLKQATDLAAKSDVAVVYANDFESEGGDLANIDLPGTQNQLISAVAAVNPRTIVVLNTGSAVTMPWLSQVEGVFEAWYPGQQSGDAIAALLFGDADPSGKLPVTFPVSLAQVPASTPAQWPGVGGTVQYSEGLKVGYRWYDSQNLTPLFPFGYGLSYTSFKVSDLALSSRTLSEKGGLTASVDVTNTGSRAGSEVVQLYLTAPASAGEPAAQLKAFAKVALSAHQTRRVRLQLSAHDASYWNTDAQAWTLAAGSYSVRVGTSSRSLPLSASFRVDHTTGPRYTKVTAPALVKPGSTITATTAFTNDATEPVLLARTSLTVPAGWTAKALTPTAYVLVLPHRTVTARWSVTVPASAVGGSADITATTRYAGSSATGKASVNVAYPNLAAAFNTVAVSDDANPAAANFDGSGYSYSAQALATAGVTPGGAVGGFTWPAVAAGQPSAVTTRGQVIVQGGSGSALAFLLAGTSSLQSGTVTVTYTDGTTSSGTVTGPDWYNNTAAPGSALVVTTPHWNRPAGSTLPADHQVSLYSSSVPLTAGKTVAYVTLPANGSLHIFATAVS